MAAETSMRCARKALLLTASIQALTACSPMDALAVPANAPASGGPVSLAVNGFNYTDLPIDDFSVAGAGGGNIFVSSPTSGGSGTSCCITWSTATKLPMPVKIEWMRNIGGKRRWCEKTVQLTEAVPDKPTAFGVHFMPDGDIQVEITHGYPKLKLRLENFDDGRRHETGNVIYDEEAARCRDAR